MVGVPTLLLSFLGLRIYWKLVNSFVKNQVSSNTPSDWPSNTTEHAFSISTLGDINSKGFSITHISNKSISDKIHYNWKNVADFTLLDNYRQLRIFFKDQSELLLDDSFHSWHALLKSIPKGFANYPYEIVKKLSPKYSNCQICGAIAVFFKTQRCKCCNNKVQPEVREATIRQHQLEWFAFQQAQASDTSKDFPIFPDWIPLVSAQEILHYRQSKNKIPLEKNIPKIQLDSEMISLENKNNLEEE